MKRVFLAALLVCSQAFAAQQVINVGSAPNDGTGDTARTWAQKDNANFSELFNGLIDPTAPPAFGTTVPNTGAFSGITVPNVVYDVRAYGAVWDGSSHPLSGYYGSLGAAQAAYSFVTSLSEEIDGAAVQLAINTACALSNGNAATVRVPNGTGRLSRTLTLNCSSVSLVSQSQGQQFNHTGAVHTYPSRILWVGASDVSGTTNAVTAAANSTLHFASTPASITAGMYVSDTTTATVLGTAAQVVSQTGTTVVLNYNALGAGVGSGDTIYFRNPMLVVGPAYNLASGLMQSGNNVSGITFDANSTAGECSHISSVRFSVINIGCLNPNGVGIYFDVTGVNDSNDTQMNDVWVEVYTTSTQPGIKLDANTPNNSGHWGNVSSNHFYRVYGFSKNSDLLYMGNTGHNTFDIVFGYAIAGGSPGYIVDFKGNNVACCSGTLPAVENWFGLVSGSLGGINAAGTEAWTYPSHNNVIKIVDVSNGVSYPTIGTTATLCYGTTNTPALGCMGALSNYPTAIVAQSDDAGATLNAPGQQAVNLQQVYGAATQQATGAQSVIMGGENNTAAGPQSIVSGGNSNVTFSSAVASRVGGVNAATRNYGEDCWGNGNFAGAQSGTSGTCVDLLRGTGASASAFRLTSNAAAAGSANCVNILANVGETLAIYVNAFDNTTVAKNASWNGVTAYMTRAASLASTALNIGSATPAATYSNGTLTGMSLSITADTTNGCLNISFTPPSGNTDTWDVSAMVRKLSAS